MPGIPLGCAEISMDFPGTVSVRGQTLKHIIYDVCSSIAKHGFKYIAISNQHLDLTHLKAILEGMKEVKEKYNVEIFENLSLAVHSESNNNNDVYSHIDLDLSKEIHADFKETSFIKYKYPVLLRDNYKELSPVHINIGKEIIKGKVRFKDMGADLGYIGSPQKATEEFGKHYFENAANTLADLTIQMGCGSFGVI